MLTASETASVISESGQKKAALPPLKQFILGILAGVYIAFAAEGSNVAVHTMQSVGLAKALAGAMFATGLMLVFAAGAELFTGNCLMVVACLQKKISWISMLKNWFFVYAGNFVGAVFIAFMIYISGQLSFSDSLLGGFTIKTAIYKTDLSFVSALTMGILCNWLVCLAVWMASAAKDAAGKLLAIFFPIWLFIASGFEHSVANMYYIPAGILAKTAPKAMSALSVLGVGADKAEGLNLVSFFIGNLIPVTIGNIIGGAVFVGLAYWFVYLRR
jgi:formate/nitrite transporter